MTFKQPVSVLVLVYTRDLRVLLVERADFADHWQSVTGSCEPGELLVDTAVRELAEETGLDAARFGGVVDWRSSTAFEIYSQWRHRYPPGTLHNTEHVFSLAVPAPVEVRLNPREHRRHLWLPWQEAAQRCFSWTNREAILALPARAKDPENPL